MIFVWRINRFRDKERIGVEGDSWAADKEERGKKPCFSESEKLFRAFSRAGGEGRGRIIFQRRPVEGKGEERRYRQWPAANVERQLLLSLYFSLFFVRSFFPSFDFRLLIRSDNNVYIREIMLDQFQLQILFRTVMSNGDF